MNKVKEFAWKLLSTDQFNDISALAVKHPGAVAKRAAEDCLRDDVLAVREEGKNRGRWVLEYLKAVFLGPGNPWCQAFVVYRLIKAAHTLIINIPKEFPRTGSCTVSVKWAQSEGHFIRRADVELRRTKVQVGDIAYFWFPNLGRWAHTGIVVEVNSDGSFVTVEGNTAPSPSSEDVVREGQGVYAKSRTLKSLGVLGGFMRLPY